MHKNLSSCKKHLHTRIYLTGAWLCLLAIPSFAAIDDQLSGVKSEINRQEQQLVDKNKKLNDLQAFLESQEQSINTLTNKIRNIHSNLSILSDEITLLRKESAQLKADKAAQLGQLEQLINTQYRQGAQPPLGALLGGDQNTDFDRMTVYVEHLSRAHASIIANLSETDLALSRKESSLKQQTERQNELLSELNESKQNLENQSAARQKTARAIRRQIQNDKSYLAELRDNQTRLLAELEKAKERARLAALENSVKMDGLGRRKASLDWPVKGDVLHTYGSPQTGNLRWSGIVISAREGTEVKAAHEGTVVLSNWLRGYGLMVVIDHGKGDMSFYGYNQALLRNVGDRVKAGDPIALVGNSGGQSAAGLYFEIRRKGNAINPTPWLKR